MRPRVTSARCSTAYGDRCFAECKETQLDMKLVNRNCWETLSEWTFPPVQQGDSAKRHSERLTLAVILRESERT